MNKYCQSRFATIRRKCSVADIGGVKVGGDYPIAVQSMTNTKTQDVEASVKQCIALAEAGCQIIRLTAQNLEAAKALGSISKKFRAAGFSNPLVADIHFLPQTAMEAAEHVEKIRINPGNFTDKKIQLKRDLSDSEYSAELDKVREKLTPLVLRCKELGRALRIGTNHGSLSDRIVNRYGDTSLGMVEAAFEFVDICEDLNFHNIVLSFKASNTRIMTQTYRLAAKMMDERGFSYPLHLGVTEAGFGNEARIKSSIGIGGLLFDGLGDTIRVSLTEDPVQEVPVAIELAKLADKVRTSRQKLKIENTEENLDYFSYSRRETIEIPELKLGGSNAPQTVSQEGAKSADIDLEKIGAVFVRPQSPEELENAFKKNSFVAAEIESEKLEEFAEVLKRNEPKTVFVAPPPKAERNSVGEARLSVAILQKLGLGKIPVWLKFDGSKIVNRNSDKFSKLNEASIYLGSLLCDGIGDAVSIEISDDPEENVSMALAILQGARARKSKAEYIACPSCGRTLYDIQSAAAKIKSATEHLKDVTIGIMGCVVNGPGEMADADFGYVGGAPGKINLYKGKECVEMNIPQEESIEHLIALIKREGKWVDPQ